MRVAAAVRIRRRVDHEARLAKASAFHRFPLSLSWDDSTLGPVDQPTAREMTCFANNIGRNRVIDSDRVASPGPYPKCAMHESVHVWTVLASDDFRLSVHRVSVGFAFTGGYLNDPLEVRMFSIVRDAHRP